MDLIEFCWRSIGKPERGGFHSYFGHHHLSFDIEEGQDEFAEAVNDTFRRNGLAFEPSAEGSIRRLAPPVLQESLSGAIFASGDRGWISCRRMRAASSSNRMSSCGARRWKSCGMRSSGSRSRGEQERPGETAAG